MQVISAEFYIQPRAEAVKNMIAEGLSQISSQVRYEVKDAKTFMLADHLIQGLMVSCLDRGHIRDYSVQPAYYRSDSPVFNLYFIVRGSNEIFHIPYTFN